MRRSISVTISAILVILGSALTLLMGLFVLFVAFLLPQHAAGPKLPKYPLYFSCGMFLLAGALGLATGIGLFLLKRWARISLLVFSVLLAFTSVMSAIVFLAVGMPAQSGVPQTTMDTIRYAMAGFYLSLFGLGIWWLILFNRAVVSQQFLSGGTTPSGPQPPLSISIIAWILLIGGVMSPIMALIHFPTLLFGFLLRGWAASILYVLMGAVQIYLGFGLLKLRPRERILAVYYLLFGFVNSAVSCLLPGFPERMRASLEALPKAMRTLPNAGLTPPWWFPLLCSAVLPTVMIWFLIREKEAYLAAGKSAKQIA
jgi:hypothetical protein